MRATRAAVFAGAGTALAVVAHRLGGGMTPAPWLAVLVGCALFALAYPLTSRQRSGSVITGLVLLSQTVMHLAFAVTGMRSMPGTASGTVLLRMVLCTPAGHSPTPAQLASARATLRSLHVGSRHLGSVHAAAPMTTGGAASHAAASMSSPTMIVGHLLAAMAMAWWLSRGERYAWRYARRIVETIQRLATAPPACRCRPASAPCPVVVTLVHRVWASAAPGRAPPALAA